MKNIILIWLFCGLINFSIFKKIGDEPLHLGHATIFFIAGPLTTFSMGLVFWSDIIRKLNLNPCIMHCNIKKDKK